MGLTGAGNGAGGAANGGGGAANGGGGAGGGGSGVANSPALIEYELAGGPVGRSGGGRGSLRFLILDAPHNDNVRRYIEVLQAHNCRDLVRTCEKTYDDGVLLAHGITPHELAFPDGEPPPRAVILDWLDVVKSCVAAGTTAGVHCLAGLGRAPVLVVVALVELTDLAVIDAIELVRSRRRGAINRRQLDYLMNYKKVSRPANRCCGLF